MNGVGVRFPDSGKVTLTPMAAGMASWRRRARRCFPLRHEAGAAVATISLTLNYLAPAHGELVCKGVVARGGRSVVFAEAEVRDERGKSVCRATATYRLLPRK